MDLSAPPRDDAGPLRLALFGGAFDPPHWGHVRLVQALQAQFGVQRVWVVPTGSAWHKARPLTAAAHRLAMTRLAFAGVEGVCIDEREIRRPGPSYTVDTLAELRAEQPPAQWLLLMGEDQWARFETWHQWPRIAQMARIVVARRSQAAPVAPLAPSLPRASDATDAATPQRPEPLLLHWADDPVNSTAIRRDPAAHAHELPAEVARYISQHALYSPAP